MTTGQRLRALRALTRLSQRGLWRKSGIHFITIARIESGASKSPRMDTLQTLATALVVDLLGIDPQRVRKSARSRHVAKRRRSCPRPEKTTPTITR